MKIAISQREIEIPPTDIFHYATEDGFYNLLHKHKLYPFPNLPHLVPYYEDYDCLILTGGPDSKNRNMTENLMFVDAFNKGLPIIGICHGAFAVNELTGGKNRSGLEGHYDTHHKIKMEDRHFLVNSYHKQAIDTIGKNMVVIATDKYGNIEAFRHKEYDIHAVVWHPERMVDAVLPKRVQEILEI